MDNKIKKQVRLLSEKYSHKINYDLEILNITNNFNNIKLVSIDRENIQVEYNADLQVTKLTLVNQEVFHTLIELFLRTDAYQIQSNNGFLLTLNDWFQEEGSFAKESYESLKKVLQISEIEYLNLGGNRIEAEYYKGVLILTDDVNFYKSNLIEVI